MEKLNYRTLVYQGLHWHDTFGVQGDVGTGELADKGSQRAYRYNRLAMIHLSLDTINESAH